MRFEWNPAKDAENRRKHGVSFAEACELLESEADHLEIYDEAHSEHEDRFISIGPIRRGIVLVVWTERTESTIRILSARWATSREQELYLVYMKEHHV